MRTVSSNAATSRSAARLAAVILPCGQEEALRSALAKAATAAGLTCVDESGGAWADGTDADLLLICSDASIMEFAPPQRVAIVAPAPGTVASAAALRHGISDQEGLGYGARCLAAATDLARSHGAVVVGEADLIADPPAAFTRLLGGLGLSNGADSLGPLTPLPATTAGAALNFYGAGIDAVDGQGWWDRSLFRSGDEPDRVCPETVDITGRGRILIFGPLLALPGGRWSLTARFELCDEASRHPFILQFGEGENLAELRLQPSRGGLYEVELEHAWPSARPIELRLWLARAAFHGRLSFGGAAIRRVEPPK